MARKPEHELAALFPKITHAVLEGGSSDDDQFFTSYDESPVSSMVSECPRLVATYRLVKVQLLVKKQHIVAIKQRRRKK